MRWLRQLACRAYWTALEGRPGPVHLNFSLREPLVLDEPLPAEEPGGGGRDGGRPWVTRPRSQPVAGDALIEGLRAALDAHPRAVMVAGRSERDPGLGKALASLADQLALPLLAEPLSGARRGRAAIAHYDALLRDPASPPPTPPTSSCASATSPPRSRCASGSTASTRSRSPSTPRPRGRTRRAASARS